MASAARSCSSRHTLRLISRASVAPRLIQATPAPLSRSSSSVPPPPTTFFPTDSPPSSSSTHSLLVPKPANPFHYTTQPSLYLALANFDQLLRLTRTRLHRLGILPSADSALTPEHTGLSADVLGTGKEGGRRKNEWIGLDEVASRFNVKLGLTNYRLMTRQLSMLAAVAPYAVYADDYVASQRGASEQGVEGEEGEGEETLAAPILAILTDYRKPENDVQQVQPTSGTKLYKYLRDYDPLGRMFGSGRRKEASARVWLIPASASASSDGVGEAIGTILMNGKPIHTRPLVQRSQIVRPMMVTETLGRFNAFAIAHGGGSSAQAQAVGLAIARALASVEWKETGEMGQWGKALKRENLLRRDPRMVERKKTNMKGARAAYTWVKR